MLSHPNIIFTRVDKDNTIVALDKDTYVRKLNLMSEDKEIYEVANKYPIKNSQ